jgi:hypothetical protein
MDTNTVINLQPIITTPEHSPVINSFYLYIFAIFEFIVIILILYYFFYIEIIFLYNMVFKKDIYNDSDKKTYNNYMEQFKKLVEYNKKCIIKGNKYVPITDNNIQLLALNNNEIAFESAEKCNNFLNL